MWYFVAAVLGAMIGAAGVYFFARQTEISIIQDISLQAAVEQLHSVLFMAAGTRVGPFFDAVWGAAGLEEKGVPNIYDGST